MRNQIVKKRLLHFSHRTVISNVINWRERVVRVLGSSLFTRMAANYLTRFIHRVLKLSRNYIGTLNNVKIQNRIFNDFHSFNL